MTGAATTSDTSGWTEPGAFEVSPGIHRIPLPLPNDGLRAVNVYAISDGDFVVMIDSGWALSGSKELLARSLDQIGYGLGDISEFLVTHMHRDHYTQAVAVRREFGTRVSLGEGERPSLEIMLRRASQPLGDLPHLRAMGAAALVPELLALGYEDADDTTWEPPDRWLTDSVEIPLRTRTLTAVHTPGHTQGHLVFHDAAANTLFAGDHVLPRITPSIGFEPAQGKSPLDDYLRSLELVRAMPNARLLPAHGPVTESTHARIDELLDHHATRLDLTLAAVTRGAHTAYEAAGQLGWTRRNLRPRELDLFNRMLTVTETSAHLETLVTRGQVLREVVDGVACYQLA